MNLKPVLLKLDQIDEIIHFKTYKKLYLGGYIVALTSLIALIAILCNLNTLLEYAYITAASILMVSGVAYASKNKNPYENTFRRAKKLQKILNCPEGADLSSGTRLKLSGIINDPISITINGNQFLVGGGKEQIDLSIKEAKKLQIILENEV